MTEIISRSENPKLGLKVTVSSAEIAAAQSVEQMAATLTEHVADCRRCLAMVLFREESLAELGCDGYKRLLAEMQAICRVCASLASGGHIDQETLDDYCFHRLPVEGCQPLEEHLSTCKTCTENFRYRLEFISCMKGALKLLAEHDVPEGMDGGLVVHCPDRELSICATMSF